MRLKKPIASALAALLLSGPAAAEIARLPERLELGVSIPVVAAAPAPGAALGLPEAPASLAPQLGLPPMPAAPTPTAAGASNENRPNEDVQASVGAAFDGSGGPRKPSSGSMRTTAVLRGIGLTTALSAAFEPWHSMHPVWAVLGAVPLAAGLALGISHISLREPVSDRPLKNHKTSMKHAAVEVWRALRKKGPPGAPKAIAKWRYVAALKGPWPTIRLAGPGIWFVTTGLRVAANATLAAWVAYAPVHILGRAVQVAGLALAAFSAYFYRDPQRLASFGPDDVAAPADGRVMSVGSEAPGSVTIRIFLSPFNVHVQRAPFAGQVTDIRYARGQFVVASSPEAARKNERNSTRIDGASGRVAVVDQLTGFIARRIASWVEPGDKVRPGDRIGMIFFGSQVALHLPASARVLVAPGDKVVGGRSIVARF